MSVPKFEKLIIDVQARDLERAILFYKNVLGLPLITKADTWASFEVWGAEIHLYTGGGIEYGLEFRVKDITREVKMLKEKGVQFTTQPNWPQLIRVLPGDVMEFPWGKMAVFHDSEGNRISLVEDQ
jgi:predicted enzyme related to lactoylglutathione lyase